MKFAVVKSRSAVVCTFASAVVLIVTGCSSAKPIAVVADSARPGSSVANGVVLGRKHDLRVILTLLRKFQVKGVKFVSTPEPVPYGLNGSYPTVTVRWDAPAVSKIEIHMQKPDGTLFAAGGNVGTATTGPWVQPQTIFYLQDVSNGSPGTTLAVIEAVLCKSCKA